jgi:hypothetical protein
MLRLRVLSKDFAEKLLLFSSSGQKSVAIDGTMGNHLIPFSLCSPRRASSSGFDAVLELQQRTIERKTGNFLSFFVRVFAPTGDPLVPSTISRLGSPCVVVATFLWRSKKISMNASDKPEKKAFCDSRIVRLTNDLNSRLFE